MILCPVVQLCLSALQDVLPPELALDLLCSYARAFWTFSPPRLLDHFFHWLGVCLGLPHHESGESPSGRHEVMSMDSHALWQLPALKLLVPESPPLLAPPPPDSVAIDKVCLGPYRQTSVLAIHLVYEV